MDKKLRAQQENDRIQRKLEIYRMHKPPGPDTSSIVEDSEEETYSVRIEEDGSITTSKLDEVQPITVNITSKLGRIKNFIDELMERSVLNEDQEDICDRILAKIKEIEE